MNNIDTYRSVFQTIFGVDSSALNEHFNFKDIEAWDSLTHLTLINEIELAFDIMFETDDILHFGGYMNGIEILKKYGVNFEG